MPQLALDATHDQRQRLKQRETQSAIFVFDGEIDLDQPLVVRFLNEQNGFWEQVLPRIERERALVRARSLRSPTQER